jgi:Tfp pilus assembly protein PilN
MANAYDILKPRAVQLERIQAGNRRIRNQMAEWGRALMEEPEWLPVLSGIAEALPEGLRLTTAKLDGSRGCILNGTTTDAETVTALAKSLIRVSTVRQVEIVYLKSRAGQAGVEFAVAFAVGKKERKR